MKQVGTAISAVLVGVLVSAPWSWAGDASPGINTRQENQQERIEQGVKSGELTKGETAHLEKQERHINREKKRFKADGNFTPAERAKLEHDQNRASRHIAGAKHNDRTAPDVN